jgi:hypothetical protein
MKKTVYIETSVISFLTARPSMNVILAGHQASTQGFWDHLDRYDVYISDFVLQECAKGDSERAEMRLNTVKPFPLLDSGADVETLTHELIQRGAVPAKCIDDAAHIAVAAIHGIDFIVTWNFKHINNPVMKGFIEQVVVGCGYMMPIICSPEELEGGSYE